MSQLQTLLIAAGLAAGSLPAVAAPAAAPSPATPSSPNEHVERFAWSTMAEHGRLGVMVIGLTPELREHFGAARDRGMLVGRVEPASPAARAGFEVGDVVVAASGHAVTGARELLAALAEVKKGQTAAIDVIRDHKALMLRPTLTEDPLPQFAEPEDVGAWPEAGWFDEMFGHAFGHRGPPKRPSGKT